MFNTFHEVQVNEKNVVCQKCETTIPRRGLSVRWCKCKHVRAVMLSEKRIHLTIEGASRYYIVDNNGNECVNHNKETGQTILFG